MPSTLAFAPCPEDLEDLDLGVAVLTFAPPPRPAVPAEPVEDRVEDRAEAP